MTKSLVFIDSRVADTSWILLDSDHDGIEQMQAALAGYSGLESIQIVSHGSSGALWLGTTLLDQSHVGDYLQPLHAIGQALAPTGDLLLYGCNVAAGEVGRGFIAALAEATGADVAASTNPTGAAALGGDWVLERATGSIEATGLHGGDLPGLLSANTAPTFVVGDGMVTTNFSGNDIGRSVTVQADGKILIAGSTYPSSYNYDIALVRYNTNGSLDTSFDGDGKVTTYFSSSPYNPDFGNSLTVQADGKILVAGTTTFNIYGDISYVFALARYNTDGSLDTSFDGDGKVTTYFDSSYKQGHSVTIQGDGKILVAGGYDNFELARYNTNGSLDTSFDGDGKVTTDFGDSIEQGYSVTVQADGKILVAGCTRTGIALTRYNTNGSLDTSFDGDGKVTDDIVGSFQQDYSVTVQADGKILVAGRRGSDFALTRYNTNGSLDTSFDGDGKVTTDFGGEDIGYSVSLQADGKILVGGASGSDFALARYNTNGSLDTSFDGDGKVTTDFGGQDFGYSVSLQADGKILVAGESTGNFALARYNADGSFDRSFSLANTLTLASPTYSEQSSPLVLDRDVQIADTELSALDNFNGATLTLSRHGGANADDVFSAASGGSLSALQSGSVFSVNGVVIGQVMGNSAGTLTLAFTADATQSRVNSAIEQIAYANTSDTPPATVPIDWNFSDGNSGAQGTGGALGVIGSTTVHITSVNDVPTLATPLLDQYLAADLPFSYTMSAGTFNDLDLDTLTYSASMADGTSIPLWLSFNTVTHSFTGTPGANDVGVADIRVTATDAASATANDVFRLIVAVPINGTAGDDSLSGGAGFDILNGFAGNDTLNGGSGNDLLTGGTGNDTYVVDGLGDMVNELAGEGTDTIQTGITYTLATLTNVENLTLAGGAAVDATGNLADNLLVGNSAANTLSGDAGNDTLDGGAGADTMIGGDGNDTYTVDNAGDLIAETNADLAMGGDDTVYCALSAYTLTANVENLRLLSSGVASGTGNSLNNTLTGGTGDNVLDGGAGADALIGGTGNDTYVVDVLTDVVTELAGEGIDTIQTGISYSLASLANVENLTLTGVAAVDGTGNLADNTLVGNSAANTLNGSAGNDSLSGGAGADTMIGGEGSDTLDGGADADMMIGGDGSDTYTVDHAGDLTIESNADLATGGDDTVYSTLSATTLSANVENLYLLSGGVASGTGNSLNNTLYGGAGDNVLDGGAGADAMIGGTGNDTYVVDVLADAVTELTGEGIDTILTGITYTLASLANVENLTLTGAAVINGTGNLANNVLIGNSAANQISGDAGNDTLDAGAGNDTLDGGAGADTMIGGDGNDTYTVDHVGDLVTETNADLATGGNDTVLSTLSAYTLTANVENLRLLSTGVASGTGNSLNNTLTGGTGDNVFDGGVGSDAMIGGAGNDTYVVDGLTDTVTEIPGEGTDTVQTGITYSLAALANVENLTLTGAAAVNGSGNFADNLLVGNSAANQLSGNAGNDTLNAGPGNDTLDGGTGADTMIGGDGSDTYTVDSAGDLVTESNADLATGGTDTVNSSLSAYTLGANVENLCLLATGAADGTGNALNNTLYAGAGDNVLDGGAGTDTVSYAYATAGVTASLASGYTTVGSGFDILVSIENVTGSNHNDSLTGNSSANVLNGGVGADTLIGGDGSDLYYVDNAGDLITEINANLTTGGTDLVYSTASAYTLSATNVENLRLLATGTANGTGNALNNTLYAGAGDNVLDGGAGTDTVSYAYATAGVAASLASGHATGGSGSDTLISIENLNGSNYNDSLTGSSSTNILNGGAGADTLIGGDGSDTYTVDNAGDLVTETNADLATGGSDMVYSTLSAYTLTANVENLRLLASGAANGTGNSLNNTLYAGAGDNVLDGGAGTDTVSWVYATAGVTASLASGHATTGLGSDTLIGIENLSGSNYADNLIGNSLANTLNGGGGADMMMGGDGSDIYYVDNSLDSVSETNALASTGGTDTVYSYLSAYSLTANVENLRLLATSAANGSGNSLNNTLYAGAGNNSLDGGTGTDTVSYVYAAAGVTVSLATSLAQTTGGSGSDTLLNIENLVGSNANDSLTGNSGANNLSGGAGNDLLSGGLGNDLLTGGLGSDIIRFDTLFSTLANSDTITDYNVIDDTIQLENSIFAVLTTPGTLAADSFVSGPGAHAVDANDYVIYNSTTGALYYDVDGNGAGAAVQFATLTGAPALTNLDFMVT